ncbi:MAG: hypothetical protein GY794_12520 [bacterium]|nr:hypothetical protein [bacterium]
MMEEQSSWRLERTCPDTMSVLADARVYLSPLRFGAGIKGNLPDTLQMGTSV